MSRMLITSVTLPVPLIEELDAKAKEYALSRSGYIRHMLRKAIDRENQNTAPVKPEPPAQS